MKIFFFQLFSRHAAFPFMTCPHVIFSLRVLQLGFGGCVENAWNANWVDPTSSARPATLGETNL